jgi:hypothetical protein
MGTHEHMTRMTSQTTIPPAAESLSEDSDAGRRSGEDMAGKERGTGRSLVPTEGSVLAMNPCPGKGAVPGAPPQPAQASGSSRAASAFTWKAHPAAERVGPAVMAGVAVLAIGTAVALSFASIAWGALSVVVLVASLNRFFFPSRFSIDEQGITARLPLGVRRLRWSEARRFAVDRRGGYLSARARRSWLDPYCGVHVLFGRRRDEVIRCIRGHLVRGGGT